MAAQINKPIPIHIFQASSLGTFGHSCVMKKKSLYLF
jgi:hypothetical protein